MAYATIVDMTGNGIEFFGPALNAGSGVLQNVTYEGTLGLGLHDDEVTATGGLTLLGAGGTGPGTIQLTGSAARLNLNGIGTLNNATVYIGSEFKYDQSVLYAGGPALDVRQQPRHRAGAGRRADRERPRARRRDHQRRRDLGRRSPAANWWCAAATSPTTAC